MYLNSPSKRKSLFDRSEKKTTNNKMLTVIDLSSDDETPTQRNKKIKNVLPATTSATNSTNTTTKYQISQQQQQQLPQPQQCYQSSALERRRKKTIDFIDHVVMIWLNRVRKGFKNLEMPHNILKSKAKEAALLLHSSDKFHASEWLTKFQEKIKEMQDKGETVDIGWSQVFRIEEIIKEERPKFFGNSYTKEQTSPDKSTPAINLTEQKATSQSEENEGMQQNQLSKMIEDQKKHLEKVKEAQKQQVEQVKEAQRQKLVNLKRKETEKTELQKTQAVSKAVPSTTPAIQERLALLRRPEELKIREVRGAVSPKFSSAPLIIQTPVTVAVPEPAMVDEVINIDDDDDVLDVPIQSYKEALDCLGLIEDYFFAVRNLKGVSMVSQIEGVLRDHTS